MAQQLNGFTTEISDVLLAARELVFRHSSSYFVSWD